MLVLLLLSKIPPVPINSDLKEVLEDIGIADHATFRSMDVQTQDKVRKALGSDPLTGKNVDENVAPRTLEWALNSAEGDPREFANHYEYAKAKFTEVKNDARDRLRKNNDTDNLNRRASQEASDSITPEKLEAGLNKDIKAVQEQGSKENLDDLSPYTTPEHIADEVQKLNYVGFETPTAAAYHARKHGDELPKSYIAENDNVQAYLDAAQDTISTGQISKVEPAGQGSTLVVISKEYLIDGETDKLMQAIIYIKSDGKVTLATYGSRK